MKNIVFTAAVFAITGCGPLVDMTDDIPVGEPGDHEPDHGDNDSHPAAFAPIVSMVDGQCGDGIINPNEQCDCGSDGFNSAFCAVNGDEWCADECKVQCPGFGDGSPEACREEAHCRLNHKKVEEYKAYAECFGLNPHGCIDHLIEGLDDVDAWHRDALAHCNERGR